MLMQFLKDLWNQPPLPPVFCPVCGAQMADKGKLRQGRFCVRPIFQCPACKNIQIDRPE